MLADSLAESPPVDTSARDGGQRAPSTPRPRTKPVNFGTVSRAAGVSRAWLYRQTDVRESIDRLPLLGAATAASGGRTTGEPQFAPPTPRDRQGER